jgi:DNA-binding Lrp family transcriptional regulator
MELDKTDKMILFELDRNSRRSAKEIAKKLRMKKDTVAYRIKRLEEEGVIKGYYALVDYSRFGYVEVRLYMRLQNTNSAVEKEIIDYFLPLDETISVATTEGDWDMAVLLKVTSLDRFNEIFKSFKGRYRRNINTYRLAIFTELLHYFRNHLVQPGLRDYAAISTCHAPPIELDDMDKRLVSLLTADAKMPLLEMSKKVGLSSMAVRYRIKQLEERKVIVCYKPLLDLAKMGYEYYKVDFVLEDLSKLKRLKQFARAHPSIVYEDITFGGSDFEFDVELRSYDEFYSLIAEMKKAVPDTIRTYEFFKARKIFKTQV